LTAWVGVILASITLLSYVLHTYFSDEAAKRVADEKAAAEEKIREDAQTAAVQATQAAAPAVSAGRENAWDAADAEMEKK
jgi:hypothetical protein